MRIEICSGAAEFIRILANCYKGVIITELNKRSFLYALRTGRSIVVEPLLNHFPRTFGVQLQTLLQFGTAAEVATVKRQIFSMLVIMIVKSSRLPITLDTFEIGINCIDVNTTNRDGSTLLMLAVMSGCPACVGLLMEKKSLKVNLTNVDGYSALDFLNIKYASCHQLVNYFLERQALFNDVDFSKVKSPLLLKTLNMKRLDYAMSLLDCSSYHASPSELTMTSCMLSQEKRVLLFQQEEGSADKKKMLLELLYKVKEKIKERRRQKAT